MFTRGESEFFAFLKKYNVTFLFQKYFLKTLMLFEKNNNYTNFI